jgi:hypothetical protein
MDLVVDDRSDPWRQRFPGVVKVKFFVDVKTDDLFDILVSDPAYSVEVPAGTPFG